MLPALRPDIRRDDRSYQSTDFADTRPGERLDRAKHPRGRVHERLRHSRGHVAKFAELLAKAG